MDLDLATNYPPGLFFATSVGFLLPTRRLLAGTYSFVPYEPTRVLTSLLVTTFLNEDAGYLFVPKLPSYHFWPTGLLVYSNSRVTLAENLQLDKDTLGLAFKGPFYIHSADNIATLVTVDSLPEHVEKILTIQG